MANVGVKTINNIIKELKSVLKSEELDPDKFNENFYKFYINLLLLDPEWRVNISFLERQKIEELIDFLLKAYKTEREPKMTLLKFQYSTRKRHEYYLENGDAIEAQRLTKVNARLHSLKSSILNPNPETVNIENSPDVEEIFKDIVIYFSLFSGMGSYSNIQIYTINYKVVKSVLSLQELKDLLRIPYDKRVTMFDDIISVCMGVRLYNNSCGYNSEGILDVPQELDNLISSLISKLFDESVTLDHKIYQLSDLLKKCYTLEEIEGNVHLKLNVPAKLTSENLTSSVQLLVLYKQSYKEMRKISELAVELREKSISIHQNLLLIMGKLSRLVIPEILISAALVFPYFMEIAMYWNTLRDHYFRLNYLVEYAHFVMTKTSSFDSFFNKMMSIGISNYRIESENDIISSKYSINSAVSRKDSLYDYNGYCCVILTFSEGLLLKGRENFGISNYCGKSYIFSSSVAYEAFEANPEYYVKSVIKIARSNCGLICYLNMHDRMIEFKNDYELVPELISVVTHADVGCQVDLDLLLDIFSSKQLSSSVWYYRKQATELLNLTTMVSKTVNTEKKMNIDAIATQTYHLKHTGTQTMSDIYTNTHRNLSFLYGLRGCKEDKYAHLKAKFGDKYTKKSI
ncbi:unnamed protein product [Phyllotreta striolata]|uniref:Cilia- and flagella-associated protein 206 n=1 Tax=Phyllotreta striolata TaxID=444603 RepID=A0A9N9XS43_PHYSR|nr:unnamed protein product [Phyllotreta striolata]